MIRYLAGVFLSTTICAQQHLTVPSAHDAQDAPACIGLAGSGSNLRQQVIIGANHLLPLVGHTLSAIEFRRNLEEETFIGGSCNIAVTLATSITTPQNAAHTFSAHLGSNSVLVHSGSVTFPTSPGSTMLPAPINPAWTTNNTIRIPFSTTFTYNGGPLIIDFIGTESAQGPGWWLMDAASEDVEGTIRSLGTACSDFSPPPPNMPEQDTAFVSPRDLVGCGTINFLGQGVPYHLAVLVLGAPSGSPIPLTQLGLPAAQGFSCQIDPTMILASLVTLFMPCANPIIPSYIGVATADLKLPAETWLLSMSLGSQWIELPTLKTSNGIELTIANQLPTLDMALIVGSPSETQGEVNLQVSPVIRFEYQ